MYCTEKKHALKFNILFASNKLKVLIYVCIGLLNKNNIKSFDNVI